MGKPVGQELYETFEHGADIGVRGYGATIEEAFSNAAKAMFSQIIVDFDQVGPEKTVDIECEGIDYESLLVAFLNELLAQADINRMVFCGFEISVSEFSVKGKAIGEKIDMSCHEPGVEVKGATFTMAKVEKKDSQWLAQCVVDV